MIYLISYDIGNDRLRTKTAKILVAAGYERIQYSVYLGISDPKKDSSLWQKLEKMSDAEDYQLITLPIPIKEFRLMEILGKIGVDLDYLSGDKHTLII